MTVRTDAERLIIAYVLHTEASVFPEVSSAMFLDVRHKTIFAAIEEMYRTGEQINLITLTSYLKKTKTLRKSGGYVYITEVSGKYFGLSIAPAVELLIAEYTQKQLLEGLQEAASIILDGDIDRGKKVAENALKCDSGKSKILNISDVYDKSVAEYTKRDSLKRQGLPTGIPTGLSGLQQLTGGWQAGELTIIAARPGRGKTAVALHFAKEAAMAGVPVAIFSLEMLDYKLVDRMIIAETGVDAERYRDGRLLDYEMQKVLDAKDLFNRLPIWIDDYSRNSSARMRRIASRLNRNDQCGMVVIDYLQIQEMNSERGKTREREVAEASKEAKGLAKELGIPVLLLSQLNREGDARAGLTKSVRRPNLSNLKESGAIEADADIVAFVFRPEMDGVDVIETPYGAVNTTRYMEFIVDKNRNGKTGVVMLRHNDTMTRFYDYNTGTSASHPDSFIEPIRDNIPDEGLPF